MRDYLGVERGAAAVQGRGHQPELQSLRGLAALIVVLHHCSFYYDYDPRLKSWSEIVLNAHAGVVLFFVLSGYVLSKSLLRGSLSAARVTEFYVRRGFRIFPALWLGVAVALLYVLLFHGRPIPDNVTAWWWPSVKREFPERLTLYLTTVAGLGTTWPLPLWTLQVELIASALLPVATLALVFAPPAFLVLTFALSAYVILAPWDVSVVMTYMPAFLLGACIVVLAPERGRQAGSDRGWLAAGLVGTLLLLFGRTAFQADFENHYHARTPGIVEAVGGTLLIAAVSVRPRPFAFLRRPGVVWLGDVSYSLYLLHLPILGLIAAIGGELMGLPIFTGDRLVATGVLTVCVLAVAVPLSALSYRYVELPCMRLGKAVGQRFREPLSAPQLNQR